MTHSPHAHLVLLAKTREVKNMILEATDELQALDELFDGYAKLWKGVPAGNTSPGGLLRAARVEARRVDGLALRALDRFMHVLALVEQAGGGGPFDTLACEGCGATVRLPRKLVESVERPRCIACHGDLKRVMPL